MAYMYRGLNDISISNRNTEFRLVRVDSLSGLIEYMRDFMVAFDRPKYMYILYFLSYLFDNNKYFICYNNENIGNCYLKIYKDLDCCVLYDFNLKLEHRGKGLSEGALMEILYTVKEKELDELCLEVHEDNLIAVKLYEKCGFEYDNEIE